MSSSDGIQNLIQAVPIAQPVVQGERSSLRYNWLSRSWRMENIRNNPALLPLVYVGGMVGYAIALPIRVAIFAISLLQVILVFVNTLLNRDFRHMGSRMKNCAWVVLGATGELFSGTIGVVCPPLAYKLDELIQSNRHIHGWYSDRFLSSWNDPRERGRAVIGGLLGNGGRHVRLASNQDYMGDICRVLEKDPPLVLERLKDDENLQKWLSRIMPFNRIGNEERFKPIGQLIYDAVKFAEEDTKFLDAFLAAIMGANESCDDRVRYTILQVGILKDVEEAKKNGDLQRLTYLLGHGNMALRKLESIAHGIEKRSAEQGGGADPLEIYLGLPVKLKDVLQLPIAVDSMQFFGCSGLTEEDLSLAQEEVQALLSNKKSYLDFLLEDTKWVQLVEAHESAEAMLEEKIDPLMEELNEVERTKEEMTSQAYLNAIQDITERRQIAMREIGWHVLQQTNSVPPFLQ